MLLNRPIEIDVSFLVGFEAMVTEDEDGPTDGAVAKKSFCMSATAFR